MRQWLDSKSLVLLPTAPQPLAKRSMNVSHLILFGHKFKLNPNLINNFQNRVIIFLCNKANDRILQVT